MPCYLNKIIKKIDIFVCVDCFYNQIQLHYIGIITMTIDNVFDQLKNSVIEEITRELSLKFNFDYEQAMKYLSLSKKNGSNVNCVGIQSNPNPNPHPSTNPSTHVNKSHSYPPIRLSKSNIMLPFIGYIHETLCKGIKHNRGLNNQCSKRPLKGYDYCVTCNKNAMKNENKIPMSGDIRNRKQMKNYLEYVTPDGKKSITYGTYLKIMKCDIEKVKQECQDLNIDIPEYMWEENIRSRGRPKIEKQHCEVSILDEINNHLHT